MKDETIKIGLVKEWGSPRSNIQLFVPQEYCENCYQPWANNATLSTRSVIYIDYYNIPIYDLGERFSKGGSNAAAVPGVYNSVSIYYLAKTSSPTTSDNTDIHSYAGSVQYGEEFTYTYNTYVRQYKLVKISGTYNIKIGDDLKAYYKYKTSS